jgi:hypothetical protein
MRACAMSLKPQEDCSVSDETRRVAWAAFPKGSARLHIGNVLGCVYHATRVWEEQFVDADGKLRFRDAKEMPSPATLKQDHALRRRIRVPAVLYTVRRENW